MAVTKPIKDRIQALKAHYDTLRKGKNSLLVMIDEAEVPESVYNSNAIENSTLTLKETEMTLCAKYMKQKILPGLSDIFAISLKRLKSIRKLFCPCIKCLSVGLTIRS